MTEPEAEHTTAKLARALREAGAPDLMVSRAAQGYYHDYLSPLTFPELQLAKDLAGQAARHPPGSAKAVALRQLRQRVINGDFDASKAESDAWAASPEGQQAFRDLLGGPMPPRPADM